MHFFGKKSSHPGIQGRRQIGQPYLVTNRCRKQLATFLKDFLHVPQLFYRGPENAVNYRQVITGIGKADFLFRPKLFQDFFIFFFSHVHYLVGPSNRG